MIRCTRHMFPTQKDNIYKSMNQFSQANSTLHLPRQRGEFRKNYRPTGLRVIHEKQTACVHRIYVYIYIYRLQEAHRISAIQIVSKLKPVSCNNYYMYSLCISVLSYQSYGSQEEIVHFFYILQRMCFTCMHFLIISLIMYVYITNFEAVR